MHGAYLVCRERFTEQVDSRHLTAENSLFVELRRRTDVAFVEGLQQITNIILITTFNNSNDPLYLDKCRKGYTLKCHSNRQIL